MTAWRVAPRLVVAAASWLFAPSLVAQPQEPPPAGYSGAALVPRTIDTLVMIEDGASLRQSRAGRALLSILGAQGALDPTEQAWMGFATQLGLEPGDAFDRVLGARLVFASRTDEAGGGVRSWLIRSHVTRETEQRLRERLKPVPRAIKGGLPILSVEGGAYEMVVIAEEGGASVMLAPTKGRALFDELVDANRGLPVESFADAGVLKEMASLGKAGDVVIFQRLPPEVKGWAALSASVDDASVSANLLVRGRAFARAGEIDPWCADWFADAEHGAYAAVLDRRAGPGARVAPLNLLARSAGLFADPMPGQELLGDRSVLVVSPSDAGPCSIVLGVETLDIRSVAPAVDAEVARQVGDMAQQPGVAAAHDWKGQFITALRTTDLSRTIGGVTPLLWREGPTLAWGYFGAGEPTGEAQPGWIAVGVDSAAQVQRIGAMLSRSEVGGENQQPWVGMGVVRPRALLGDLRDRRVRGPAGLESLEVIEEVRWRLWMAREGVVVGTAELRVNP